MTKKLQDPDPLVRGMDPRIRIHTKMSWIRKIVKNSRWVLSYWLIRRGADLPSPHTVKVCSERLQSGPGGGPPAHPRVRRAALPQGHTRTAAGPVQVFRLVQPLAAAAVG